MKARACASVLAALLTVLAEPLTAGDIAAGRAKSVQCLGCHGADGLSVNDIWPHLAGQKAGYLARQLRAYRAGERTDPIMVSFSRFLSDQDIEDLAAYYSSLGRNGQ